MLGTIRSLLLEYYLTIKSKPNMRELISIIAEKLKPKLPKQKFEMYVSIHKIRVYLGTHLGFGMAK